MTTTNTNSSKVELVKNTAILALGKFSSQGIVFLLLPLYTSFLAPEEYGIVDVAVTYVMLLSPALTLQTEMAVFRFLIDARDSDSEKTRIISNALELSMGLLFSVITIGFVAWLMLEIPYFGLIVVLFCSTVLYGFCLQSARGLGKNFSFAKASIISGIVTVSSNIVLIVCLGLGASALLISLALAQFASTVYLTVSLRLHRFVKFSVRDKVLKKQFLSYSSPLVPNGIAWWVINGADRTIILVFMGLASNGIFAVATKFPLIYTTIFSVFGLSWTESASVNIESKNRDKFFSDTFDAAIRFFGAVSLGVIAVLPLVFHFLIDDQFEEAYVYVPAMLVGAMFNSLVGLYSAIYVAKKLTGKVATTSIAAAVISLTINLILVHHIGLFAAAAANSIAFLSMAVFRHFDLKKYVTISYDKGMLAALVVAYGLVTCSYYINNIYVSLGTISGVVLFSLFLNRVAFLGLVRRMKVLISRRAEKRSSGQ